MLTNGKYLKEYYKNICAVLDCFVQYGLKVNIDKCVFFKESVNYLRFIISREGVSPVKDKVLAVKNAPASDIPV